MIYVINKMKHSLLTDDLCCAVKRPPHNEPLTFDLRPGVPEGKRGNVQKVPVTVQISDLRGLQQQPKLVENGFELVRKDQTCVLCFTTSSSTCCACAGIIQPASRHRLVRQGAGEADTCRQLVCW